MSTSPHDDTSPPGTTPPTPTSPLLDPPITRIAILGAGPSGLTALRRLLRFPNYTTITVYDQRPLPGGVWNATPSPPSSNPVSLTTTQVPPPPEQELSNLAQPVSAIYPRLTANIPKALMAFHDMPFPQETMLFPHHTQVAAYLHQYASGYEKHLRLGWRVVGCERVDVASSPPGRWRVTARKVVGENIGEETTEWFDAVIIAAGRYSLPYTPAIPGLREWVETGKGTIAHSRDYRSESPYRRKRVLVVGASVSAGDLLRFLLPVVKTPIYQSSHNPTLLPAATEEYPVVPVPPISHIDVDRNLVVFEGDTHAPLGGIDVILFCTGYLLSTPYLHLPDGYPYPTSPTGSHVGHIAHHLLYTRDPTLAFLALPNKTIPFPTAAVQAAVLGRLWASFLSAQEFAAGEWDSASLSNATNEGEAPKPDPSGRRAHFLGYPRDAAYVGFLADMCRLGDKRAEEMGKVGGDGWVGDYPVWGERERWMRAGIGETKRAWTRLGEGPEREKVRTLEELGFEFEKGNGVDEDGGLLGTGRRVG